MGSASTASPRLLVIDTSGQVFRLLRSLNLGVSVRRVASAADANRADFALSVVAASGETDWDMIRELSQIAPTVIVATTPNDDDASRAVAAGALGYVGTHLPPEALRRAILGVLRGEHAFSRRVLSTAMGTLRSLRATNVSPLTPRQHEVIRLIAKGAGDREIGQALGITTPTVQKHVTSLLRKLNVPSRAAAVAAMSGSRAVTMEADSSASSPAAGREALPGNGTPPANASERSPRLPRTQSALLISEEALGPTLFSSAARQRRARRPSRSS